MALHKAAITCLHQRCSTRGTLHLWRTLAQIVTLARLPHQNFARTRQAKALFHATLCLQLRHKKPLQKNTKIQDHHNRA